MPDLTAQVPSAAGVSSHASATPYQQGLIIGKFAPLTLGHINLINYASTMCSKVLVLLSFDQKSLDRESHRNQRILSLKNRLRWLKQAYRDIPHVSIAYIDETEIEAYPHGWAIFADKVRDKLRELTFTPEAIFSSELAYDEAYSQYFPEMQHVIVQAARTNVPVSAAEIRNNVLAHWGYLPSVVRKDYVRKVCIIGTESCGKSTLTKYLAKLFNTSWVEEYGRTYCETEMCHDEFLLTSEDYINIAVHQKYLEEAAAKTANNGLLFCDTNALITDFYHRLYEGHSNSVVAALARAEHYDLVLILDSTVPWVADGLRSQGSAERRKATAVLFEHMLTEFGYEHKRVLRINEPDYTQRLTLAIDAVRQLLNSVE